MTHRDVCAKINAFRMSRPFRTVLAQARVSVLHMMALAVFTSKIRVHHIGSYICQQSLFYLSSHGATPVFRALQFDSQTRYNQPARNSTPSAPVVRHPNPASRYQNTPGHLNHRHQRQPTNKSIHLLKRVDLRQHFDAFCQCDSALVPNPIVTHAAVNRYSTNQFNNMHLAACSSREPTPLLATTRRHPVMLAMPVLAQATYQRKHSNKSTRLHNFAKPF